MDIYLNKYSWIVYPENDKSDLKLLITFSDKKSRNTIIEYLINKYDGELSKCQIGTHTRMVTIKNVEILNLFAFLFENNTKDYNDLELYKEYREIYENQIKYLNDTFML